MVKTVLAMQMIQAVVCNSFLISDVYLKMLREPLLLSKTVLHACPWSQYSLSDNDRNRLTYVCIMIDFRLQFSGKECKFTLICQINRHANLFVSSKIFQARSALIATYEFIDFLNQVQPFLFSNFAPASFACVFQKIHTVRLLCLPFSKFS